MRSRYVSYPREMRARAKADGRHLVTVDIPGISFQGPVTKDVVKELEAFLLRLFETRGRKEEPGEPPSVA